MPLKDKSHSHKYDMSPWLLALNLSQSASVWES